LNDANRKKVVEELKLVSEKERFVGILVDAGDAEAGSYAKEFAALLREKDSDVWTRGHEFRRTFDTANGGTACVASFSNFEKETCSFRSRSFPHLRQWESTASTSARLMSH
jgi:hypothetical protein